MYAAGAIRTRPHILLCAVAQYGRGIRPPFKDDNPACARDARYKALAGGITNCRKIAALAEAS